MSSSDDSLARARTLHEGPVTPGTTQQMRGLLKESAAETAALTAATVLCDHLNRWNSATPAELKATAAAIRQALAQNPQLVLAHYAKGFLCRSRGQHRAALKAFEETIKYAPKFARAYAQKGNELVYLGRPEAGIREVEKALKISPDSPVRGFFHWVIGRAQFFRGDHDAEAIRELQLSTQFWPDVWYNRLHLVSAHAHSKNLTEASRVLQAFNRQFSPTSDYTLADVSKHEGVILHRHPFVLAGRERFHEGLRLAGMH